MARLKISGEQHFQVGAPLFAIGPSTSGYTLYYSADGVNFTPWDEGTLADTTQVVANAAAGMFFYLYGNSDDNIVITW